MKVRIVGFRIDQGRSTCYYKLDREKYTNVNGWIEALGKKMNLALQKSHFISVRKIEVERDG